ncbi:MAG: aldehyde dehydrogenase family protein [Rhodospirillaceae bacterium]|nr:aldehyde dehydrogenase family protein [Rhodospirillaceae bacterium]
MSLVFGDRLMAIGGQMVPASDGAWITSINPATEDPIGRAPAGTKADVERAVDAALKAQPGWAAKSIWERGALLRQLAAAIRARSDEVKRIEAADSGLTIANLNGDLHKAAHHFEYFAGLATEMKGDTVPASAKGLHFTLREPYGVVGRIVPFNHPFMFAAASLAAPLVAGNAVVLKTPETSPLSGSIVGEICNAILPPGVVNIVSGFGIPVGDAIARHPEVRRIGFTGSVRTGLAIQRAAAETGVKHVTLELGGKNPLIICPDADLEKATSAAVAGMNLAWAGQSCGSTSRILVHESLYDRAVELTKAKLEAIRVGDPLDPAAQMGPLNSAAHYQRVMGYVAAGTADGARLVTGGDRPKGEAFTRGYWLAPTLFDGVTMDQRIGREEIFGPVMSFLRWTDFDDALAMANAVEYGLTAAIFTQDIGRALGAAKRFQSGVVTINHTTMHFVGLPFGGYKNSGVGGEEHLDELLSYTQTKSVHIAL